MNVCVSMCVGVSLSVLDLQVRTFVCLDVVATADGDAALDTLNHASMLAYAIALTCKDLPAAERFSFLAQAQIDDAWVCATEIIVDDVPAGHEMEVQRKSPGNRRDRLLQGDKLDQEEVSQCDLPCIWRP
eukprot:s8273_g2.t1